MYWICFGDSAKGLLQMARHELEPTLDKAHILALCDDLTRGSIADVTDRAAREQVLLPPGERADDADWQEYLAAHWAAVDALDRVDEAVLWVGTYNAQEQCGLRYAVSRLQQRNVRLWVAEVGEVPVGEIPSSQVYTAGGAVSVVTNSRVLNVLLRLMPQALLRRYAERQSRRQREARAQGGVVRYGGVGELEPSAAGYFYKRRRQLPDTERARLFSDWRQLTEQNAPLRAMSDGKLQSVAADFYDEIILSCVPQGTQAAANTVGLSMGKIEQKTGNHVSDALVFERLRALGAAGRLEIVQDAPTYRDMTIRQIGG